jgi:hypothetical protein
MINDLKSEFSVAYVRAIAHAAGYFVQEASRSFDGDGIDLTVLSRDRRGTVRSPRVELQVKATSEPVVGDPFPYDLSVKNYHELRDEEFQIPRILVVMVLPTSPEHWTASSEEALILRHCAWWLSLRGAPDTPNTAAVRVRIPRRNYFHVEPLQEMMNRIRYGGLP